MRVAGFFITLPTILYLIFVFPTPTVAQNALQAFDKDRITLALQNGGEHDFEVELALTWEQQAQGLMYRQSMPADNGMLFLYQSEGVRAMWMKNTYIPLDILFIDRDGIIVSIAERTVPHSLSTITTDQPVKAVLELNGGTVSKLGIRPGDRILHPALAKGS